MDFSFGELIVVGLIAFLVLGPEDFIRFANKSGKFLGKARDQFNNFKIMAEEEVSAVDKKNLKKDKDSAGE
jgi:Sec-independent protein translocase protein TatA